MFRVMNKFVLVLPVLFTVTVCQDVDIKFTPARFRPDYKYVPEVNTYYKEFTSMRTWSEAVNICDMEGAKLAQPTTATQVQHLLAQRSSDSENYWLGIYDQLTEGTFLTLDGIFLEDLPYSNWQDGEPNALTDDEDCVMMSPAGLWVDVPCQGKYKFICTKVGERDASTYNDACETPIKDYFLHKIGRCYKLHRTAKTWSEAYSVCEHEMASLGNIDSDAEVEVYTSNLRRYPAHTLRENFEKAFVFAGFSKLLTPNEFFTIKGMPISQVGYKQWADDEPKEGQCGGILRNGKLTSASCDVRAMFFCERALSSLPNLVADGN